jgi:uncharacterized protein
MTDRSTPHFSGRPAKRLTIWLGVRDRHGHASLEVEVLKRARKARMAGATVFEGRMGYGAGGNVHREHVFSHDRPLAIVMVDAADRIEWFVEELAGFAHGVVAAVEDVEIVDI